MVWDTALDLVLPRRCLGCGAPGTALCGWCSMPDPVVETRGALHVASATPYADAVRRAVLAYKERGRRDLATRLALLLAAAVRLLAPPAGALLVPVPSAPAVAARRGGDHVARLARRAAPTVGLRAARAALRLAVRVEDSAGLGAAARLANVRGSMRAHPPPTRRPAVLVDDVVTTGATLHEAQRALTEAGWTVVGAATVARTMLRCESAPDLSDALQPPGRTDTSGLT